VISCYSRVSDVSDELSAFRETEENGAQNEPQAAMRFSCELLMFDYGGQTYAVPAACVEGVIPWKIPVAVPEAQAKVCGVIQDRGRVVVVMLHPAGSAEPGAPIEAKRIVICNTPRGHIGLPAMATNTVGTVELMSKPLPWGVYDSKFGTFTYLDPGRYVDD